MPKSQTFKDVGAVRNETTVHHGALIDDDQRVFEIRDSARRMGYDITNISAIGHFACFPTLRLVDVAKALKGELPAREHRAIDGRAIMGDDYCGSMIL